MIDGASGLSGGGLALECRSFSPTVSAGVRERHITPLQIWTGLAKACSGAVISDQNLMTSCRAITTDGGWPDKKRWGRDVDKVFGSSNHFRDEGKAMTQDNWKNYDRIARRITERFGEWQRFREGGPQQLLVLVSGRSSKR
jgi:hypothetical protein